MGLGNLSIGNKTQTTMTLHNSTGSGKRTGTDGRNCCYQGEMPLKPRDRWFSLKCVQAH